MPAEQPPSSITARVLAPLALVVVAIAVVAVIIGSSSSGSDQPADDRRPRAERERDREPPPETYTVQPGDTLTGIAAEVGVPVERIERLNPDMDPQVLTTGQELRLRR